MCCYCSHAWQSCKLQFAIKLNRYRWNHSTQLRTTCLAFALPPALLDIPDCSTYQMHSTLQSCLNTVSYSYAPPSPSTVPSYRRNHRLATDTHRDCNRVLQHSIHKYSPQLWSPGRKCRPQLWCQTLQKQQFMVTRSRMVQHHCSQSSGGSRMYCSIFKHGWMQTLRATGIPQEISRPFW